VTSDTSTITVRTVFSNDRLGDEFAKRICGGYFPHGDEGAKTVHRYRALIFNSETAVDMLLFAFLEQVGPRGHTNSHDDPHFSFVGDQVEGV
jgi:hypothetical protein